MIRKLLVALVLSSIAAFSVQAQNDSLTSRQLADAGNLANRLQNVRLMNASGALAIRDTGALQSKDWTTDLRLQVVNVSKLPVYYASMSVIFPDLIWEETGRAYGFGIYYGESRLMDLRSVADATDKPVLPGQTFSLSVPEPVALGLKRFIKNRQVSPDALRRIELVWQEVSFGDGTGFQAGNLPYPVANADRVICTPPCTKTGIDTNWYCNYPACKRNYPNFDPQASCKNFSWTDFDCCTLEDGCRPCSWYTFWTC